MDGARRAARVARGQHGLVTLDQARAAGMSTRQVRTRLDRGEWQPVRRGVYAVVGAPPSFEQACLAACLAARVAWISHRSAAQLWGLLVPASDDLELVTPLRRWHRLDGVVSHRSGLLHPTDLALHHSVPVTTVARTLVDCVAWLPGFRLARAVDDAVRRRLVDIGHGGSDWELWVVGVLTRAGLPVPVQQFPVVVEGRVRYLDLAYPDLLIAIEFDGLFDRDGNRSKFDDDRARNGGLAADGWLVLQFTSNTSEAELADRVARAIARRRRPAA